jgi:hypothetical protein
MQPHLMKTSGTVFNKFKKITKREAEVSKLYKVHKEYLSELGKEYMVETDSIQKFLEDHNIPFKMEGNEGAMEASTDIIDVPQPSTTK